MDGTEESRRDPALDAYMTGSLDRVSVPTGSGDFSGRHVGDLVATGLEF